jgi:hypothetical protein
MKYTGVREHGCTARGRRVTYKALSASEVKIGRLRITAVRGRPPLSLCLSLFLSLSL